MKHVLKFLLLSSILLQLNACTTGVILATSAAMGSGAAVVFNERRGKETQHADTEIQRYLNDAVQSNYSLRNEINVDVNSYNRVVLLSGEVTSEHVRNRLLEMASQTAGVRRIHNELYVMQLISEAARENDSIITTKVKTKLIMTEGIDASLTQVVTSKGVVYLMGLNTREEAMRILDAARSIDGVKQVIPLFEYVQIFKQT